MGLGKKKKHRLPRTVAQRINSRRPEMALQVLCLPTAEPAECGVLGRGLGMRRLPEWQCIPMAQGTFLEPHKINLPLELDSAIPDLNKHDGTTCLYFAASL